MNKNTKIALIIAGVVALGVTIYVIATRKKPTDSGNKQKDERKVLIKRTDA